MAFEKNGLALFWKQILARLDNKVEAEDGKSLVANSEISRLASVKTGLEVSDTEEELEEGVYLTNADQLGGLNANEYVTKEELTVMGGTGGAVSSVNGKTGEVVLTATDIGAVSSVNGQTGDVTITAETLGAITNINGVTPNEDGTFDLNVEDVGGLTVNLDGAIEGESAKINADLLGGVAADNYALKANVVTSVNGQTGDVVVTEGGGSIDTSNFYSTSNPPPYPVTSVNGSTGAVQITAASLGALTSAPVSSVNGKTGAVTLAANDISGVAPTAHASTGTSYGIGTSSNYGHVKLSASTSSTSGASSGIAATPSAVKAAYDLANSALKFGYTRITLAEVDEYYDISVPANTAYIVANALDPLVASTSTMPSGNYDGFQIEEVGQGISYPCSYIVPIQCRNGLVPAITNNEGSGSLILYNHGSSSVSLKNSVNLLFFNPTSSALTYRLYNWY